MQPPQRDPNTLLAPQPLETVPGPNQPWDDEPDRAELDDILIRTRQVETDEVNARARHSQYYEAESAADQAAADGDAITEAHFRRIQAQLASSVNVGIAQRDRRRRELGDQIFDLSGRTNPTELLATMQNAYNAASHDRTRARDTADDADTAAARTGTTYSRSELDYHRTTRHHAANPTTDPAETRRRGATMREVNAQTSRDARHARNAQTTSDTRERHSQYADRYPDAVRDLADRLRQRHEAAWNDARRESAQIRGELGNWGINDDPDYPAQEADIRNMLEDYRTAIESMSPFDTARAEALADYTRLRYRLEQRAVLNDTLENNVQPNREFTGNRGIWIRDHSGEEVIIHEDGSVERDEGGEWIRRDANGRVWDPEPTALIIDQGRVATAEPLATSFSRWEVTRSPEDAQAAYDSLTAEIQARGAVEADHTERINSLSDRIDEASDIMTRVPGELSTASAELARIQGAVSDPANISKKEQKAIDAQQQVVNDLTTRLNDARRDHPAMVAQRNAEYDARRHVREELNPMRYWHGFFEVGSRRTVAEAQARGIGRWAARREAERQQDALPAEPVLTRAGMLNFDTAVINSVRSDSWAMRSDGAAVRRDRSGRDRQYDPDGYLHP